MIIDMPDTVLGRKKEVPSSWTDSLVEETDSEHESKHVISEVISELAR